MAFFSDDFVDATPLGSNPRLLAIVIVLLWIVTHMLMERNGKAKPTRQLPEPPLAPTVVPQLGHIYGLLTRRSEYLTSIGSKSTTGISTVAFPCLPRLFIISNLRIAQDVQNKAKSISFSGVGSRVCSKLGGVSPKNQDLLLHNPSARDSREPSFFSECRQAIHASVESGPAHAAILRSLEDEMQGMFRSVLPYAGDVGGQLPLYAWLQEHVCLMSTNSIYGPHNPFRDPEVVEAFWAFNKSAMPMLVIPDSLIPYLARQGYRGREKMVAAFKNYLQQDGHLSAAEVIKQRQNVMDKYQVDIDDRARIETMNCIAILENTIPSTFWTLYNTITRPELLSQVRFAAEAYVKSPATSDHGSPQVDLTVIRHDPLLFAVISETMRWVSNSQEARYVHDEDVELSCGYRLRKNSLVLMPSRCVHMDESLFPSEAPESFDHTRFLRTNASASPAKTSSFVPRGYRGFGAGDTLCPGRHLATAEVLGILALLVTQFDIEEVSMSHGAPGMTFEQLSLGFPRPDREVWVEVSKRGA